VVLLILSTHAIGAFIFYLMTMGLYINHPETIITLVVLVGVALAFTPLVASLFDTPNTRNAPTSKMLAALNNCLASTIISATVILNFSLAAMLAISLGVPLALSSSSSHPPLRFGKYAAYMVLSFGWVTLRQETLQAIWHWEILGVTLAPFVCLVWTPLMMQAGLASLFPP